MKITFLTTILALLFTLPAFVFSLGDLLNLQKKSNEAQDPVSASQPDTASETASMAGASESALPGQQSPSDQSQSRSETMNPEPPSQAQATGGGCQKNEQGQIVC